LRELVSADWRVYDSRDFPARKFLEFARNEALTQSQWQLRHCVSQYLRRGIAQGEVPLRYTAHLQRLFPSE
jgi:hypothetical protein